MLISATRANGTMSATTFTRSSSMSTSLEFVALGDLRNRLFQKSIRG